MDVEIRPGTGPAKTHRVVIDQRRQLFELSCESEPRWVRFDKFGLVPCVVEAEKETAEWIAIAQGDDDVGGRLMALAVLRERVAVESDEATRSRIRHCVLSRIEGDGVPAVRRSAATVLGSIGGPEARHSLVFAARSDESSLVRVAALAALEAWGEDETLAELARASFDAGYSYETMGAAAGLLGSADPTGAFGWLMGQAVQDTENGDFMRALLPRLARLDDPGVVDELRRVGLDRSAVDFVRAEAVKQLAPFAAENAQVRSELVGLLRSKLGRVRLAAVRALATLTDDDTREALAEFHASSVFPRERRAIEAAFGH